MSYWANIARRVAAKAGYELDDTLARAFGSALFEARAQGHAQGLQDYPDMPGHEAEHDRIKRNEAQAKRRKKPR